MPPPRNFLNQPVERDTTPHPPGEILRRLALVLFWGSLATAPLLAFLALAKRDEALMRHAWTLAGLFLLLLATRRWWRAPRVDTTPPAAAPAVAPAPTPGGRPRVLLLNASLAGPEGNSARLLASLATRLAPHAEIVHAELAGPAAATFATLEPTLRAADAFVFATGTHWDSWSSPLQKFLEDATPAEATDLWLGKPAAVLVTEHSVGGKGVLSRLQGVLATLGCSVPPLSGLVLSQAAQLARRHAPEPGAAEDFWSPEDLEVVAHNLLAAARSPRVAWRAWPVDRSDYARPWLKP